MRFSDTFDSASLDASKWQLPAEPDLIRQSDGSMAFEVGGSTGEQREVYTGIVPKYFGDPVTRIDFTFRVTRIGVHGQGGPELVLNFGQARPQRIVFAPGNSGPEIYSLFCEQSRCLIEDYESFTGGGRSCRSN